MLNNRLYARGPMYEYIQGKLITAGAGVAIVDVGGIGYKIQVHSREQDKLFSGQTLLFYITYLVKEDSRALYGFIKKQERDLFELLITFSGVGPKTALSILGHFDGSQLASIVQTENLQKLSKVPGIGKKTAERLLLELKSKKNFFSADWEPSESDWKYSKIEDGLNALVNLGYTKALAEKAIKKAQGNLPVDSELSCLISEALKFK